MLSSADFNRKEKSVDTLPAHPNMAVMVGAGY
jgi:hypothetical protein